MAYSLLRVSALVALLAVSSGGSAATIAERSVTPVVKASANYGFLNHQGLSRDSCVSTAWQGNTVSTQRLLFFALTHTWAILALDVP
jgi:hypothetical protein